jgi:tRNA modification GTPase
VFTGDTIAAIATPPGRGGIGILRISGSDAKRIAEAVFVPNAGKLKARTAMLGDIHDTERGVVLDSCLATWFPAPNSYTGEDVVEFSCHGSVPLLRRLLEIVVNDGARPAGRGEFTLRAVLNGRMDLAQAEAVNRLVGARTLTQAEKAAAQLKGSVSTLVTEIDEALLDAVARMEAAVDFADEGQEFISRAEAREIVSGINGRLKDLIARFGRADLLRDGAVVVIAGRANVGKSTLFNAILRRERSIVDEQPGTTRDYIAETVDIGGYPMTLVDTAGLREAAGGVEIEGMRRTEERLGEADAVLLVAESGRALDGREREIIEKLKGRGTPILVVYNKCDLAEPLDDGKEIAVSALKGIGLGGLLMRLEELLAGEKEGEVGAGRVLITELRQQQLFRQAYDFVRKAEALLKQEAFDELILEELNSAMRTLGEITGKKTADDVLERIFSSFCIGK